MVFDGIKNWAEMLRWFRNRARMSKSALAKRAGVTISYITKLEDGSKKPPPESLRDELAEILGLDESERKWFHIQAEVERADKVTVKYLMMLNEELRESKDRDISAPYIASAEKNYGDLCKIPIINKAAAGYAVDFTDLGYPVGVSDSYIAVPDVSDPNAFAFYVSGDSMTPDFPDGTLLIASPSTQPFDGDCCFVRFSELSKVSGCTFKKVYFTKDGKVRLVPLNQRYEEQVFSREEIIAIWPVIRVYGKLNRSGAFRARRKKRSGQESGSSGGYQALTAG